MNEFIFSLDEPNLSKRFGDRHREDRLSDALGTVITVTRGRIRNSFAEQKKIPVRLKRA